MSERGANGGSVWASRGPLYLLQGCGQNIFRDAIGRVIAKDYSTCLPSQTYTGPPALDTGDNTEAFYRYDAAGRLSDVYDQAQHTAYGFDARNRVTSLQTWIAGPTANGALPDRYASQVFSKRVTNYSRTNLPLVQTTGATGADLAPNGSSVTTNYGYAGYVASITSSYGTLLKSQTFDARGALQKQVFGDIANTTADFAVDALGRLRAYNLYRAAGAGPWVANASYSPPPASDTTVRGVLMNLSITTDWVGNPTSITDSAPASEWPDGYKPVASQIYSYNDDYRLGSVATDTGNDKFVSPYVASDGTTYPQPTTPGLSRIKSQGFTYDLRGNTTSTTDDAQLFFDRSLGTITNAAAGYGPDQVASATLGSQSLKTSYDAAGNLTQIALQPSGTEYDYTWDEVGRLATAQRVENGQTVAQEQFAYDANGARRRKTRHDFATGSDEHTIQVFDSLVLDGAAFANGTYKVTSLNQNLYLAGGLAHVFYGSSRGSATLPNAGTSNGSVHLEMLLRDPRGSSSFVVDHDTSELVERTTYQAYGAVETDYRAERWGNFREDVKFSGHWDDAEVGLSYFGARYYAPQLGRFISPDPMTIHAFAADPNPYAYVGGSPIGRVDPMGYGPEGGGCNGSDPCSGAAVGISGDDLGEALKRIGRGAENAGHWVGKAASDAANWTGNAFSDLGDALFGSSHRAPPPPVRGTVHAASPQGETASDPLTGHEVSVPLSGNDVAMISGSMVAVPEVIALGALASQAVGGGAFYAVANWAMTEGAATGIVVAEATGGLPASSGPSVAAEGVNPNILSGHGEFLGGEFTVPEGTTVSVWTGHGGEISDALGNAIETGGQISIEAFPEVEGAQSYLSGSTMPNYTLSPPTGLNIMGNPTTVAAPTQLSSLVGPGMGNVQWAACLYCAP